jgi:DNA-binding transcriptional ArsR family regulator
LVADAPEMMSALAEPIRQTIFDRLADGPRPVGELAAELPISRPAVSQHLKVLKDVGLVVDRKAGTRRLYQVDPAGLQILRSYLDGMWERSLASFEESFRDAGA